MYTVESIEKINGAEPYGIYDCCDGVSMMLYNNVSAQTFAEYEKTLENAGYDVFDSRDIAGNIHYTLRNDGMLIQLYRSVDGDVRVIADNYTAMVTKEPSEIQRCCSTELYQFETDHSLIDCGMCYIIRCADNSFFIIDSAHFYSIHDNDRIHDLLRSMTPENEKIRIAGWFLSHGHDDHICKCKDYLLYNMDDTVIDAFYYNFIDDKHPDNGHWDGAGKGFRRCFYDAVKASGVPVIKLHTGQHFYVRNLEFEVLCTHEDVWPASCRDYNNSSTVLMMTAENTKVLFPGDASNESSRILEERYADYLKCDIVQLSHHGHNGTSAQFYRYADAKVVLCPNTQIKIDEEFPRFEANRVAYDIADEFYVSANGTVKLTLPYKPGTAEIFPDETNEDFDGIKQLWNYQYTDEFKKNHIEGFIRRGGRL